MIRIVTIEREYGCGGTPIAAQLARSLRWKLWDEGLCEEIARLAQCDRSEIESREERMDSLYYRLLKSFLRGSHEGNMSAHELKMLDADTIFELSKQVIEKVARQGECVIVGRGSQFFLADRPDVLRVFLFASSEEKLRRMKAMGKSASEAQHLVETVDNERAAFIKRYFNKDWPNRTQYHLMLNTAMGDEAVVAHIESAMKIMSAPELAHQ